jgi:hypothetical protein
MTYPEKKAATLVLYPEVVVIFDENYSIDEIKAESMGFRTVRRNGTVTATAYVKLAMVEPMTKQTIWQKRIEIPAITESINVNLFMDQNGKLNPFNANVDNSDAVAGEILNNLYPQVMQKFWSYLNSEEIASMRKSAEELRSRKVY